MASATLAGVDDVDAWTRRARGDQSGTDDPAPLLAQPSAFGGQYDVLCSDCPNPCSAESYEVQALLASIRSDGFGRSWAYTAEAGATWPVRSDADRYSGPYDKPLSAPVLVVGTRYDPAAPYFDSLRLADILSPGRLLTVDGRGHTALLNKSTCASEAEARYLIDGTLPPAGTVCAQDEAPFWDSTVAGDQTRSPTRTAIVAVSCERTSLSAISPSGPTASRGTGTWRHASPTTRAWT